MTKHPIALRLGRQECKNYLLLHSSFTFILECSVFPIQSSDVCSKTRLIRKITCTTLREANAHRRPSHPVVHQMSLHPDYHQWATGGPPDVATSSGPPDVALAVGTRMPACGCNADADIKWPTGCTHPVVHPMCTHAVVHRMRTSTGHEDVRCWRLRGDVLILASDFSFPPIFDRM